MNRGEYPAPSARLSIAMCTHNGSRYLRQQLNSISAQTRLPDEVVICDDDSTDGTPCLVETWARGVSFPVRLHVNRANLGVIKNFERAISLCSGDIIVLSDQDDVWRADKLAQQAAVLEARPEVGLVFSDAEVVDDRLQPLGYSVWDSCRFSRAEQALVKEGKAVDVLLRRNVVTGGTAAFRSSYRSLVLPIPRNPVHLHDYWIAFLIASVGQVDFLQDRLVQYRQQPDQQVGAHQPITPRWLLEEARRNSREVNANRYHATVDWFEEVRLMLDHAGRQAPCHPWVIEEIDEKLALCRERRDMPDSRTRRLPSLLRDVVTLRYHRYSTGMWAAIRDLAA